MKNPLKRKAVITEPLSSYRDIPTGIAAPPPSKSCAGCGGLFLLEYLTSVPTVVVYTDRTGDVVSVVTDRRNEGYCLVCKPEADIIFTVQAEGDTFPSDRRHFRVSDLYFQEADEDSGDDIYTASIEEHSHIYCADCGEMSDWEKHSTCPYQKAKAPPRKAAKKS
ncbi:hypothetical protein LCGC14_0288720 [marine sediment metagenome]|uniref:Uncharacterized protein n=1 Tax=marine sediment metagenome TaxID=412755 RepID=A0A0F9TTQ1_9ZZZZ